MARVDFLYAIERNQVSKTVFMNPISFAYIDSGLFDSKIF